MGRLKLAALGPLLGPLLLGSVYLFGAAIVRDQLYLGVASGVLVIVGAGTLYLRLRHAARPLSEDIYGGRRRSRRGALASAPKLGELIVGHYHWVGERDMARALALQKRTGQPLSEVLIRLRLVSPEQVAQALREHPGLHGGPPLTHVSEGWTGRRRDPS